MGISSSLSAYLSRSSLLDKQQFDVRMSEAKVLFALSVLLSWMVFERV